MCFATLAAVGGLAGAAASAGGAVLGGQATAESASYQAEVALNNQKIANANARYATAAGLTQAANQSQQGADQVADIKVAQAANGIDVNSGSNLQVQKSARMDNQVNAETTLNNAQLKAYGYRTDASNFGAQAGLDTMEAEQAPIGADIGAAGGLLSGASGVAAKWPTIFGSGASTAPIVPLTSNGVWDR